MSAGEVTRDGHVIPPLNITNPAPSLNLQGFFWDAVDEKIQGLAQNLAADDEPFQPVAAPHTFGRAAAADPPAPAPITIARGPAPPPVTPAPAVPGVRAPLVSQDTAAATSQFNNQIGLTSFAPKAPAPPKFPLAQFQGAYAGNGFNLIFRPRSNNADDGIVGQGPSDNVLELNLTTEQVTFGAPLGDIPNRGFADIPDITLGGIPYVQTVQDVTNPDTGRGDSLTPTGIHFEPGVFLYVQAASFHAGKPDSVVRMACIPHGTTINAQGLIPNQGTKPPSLIGGLPTSAGAPNIPDINTTPFFVASGAAQPFPSMKVANKNSFRIPQNLDAFNTAKTITDEIILNPNTVLKNANKGLNITESITFEVSTGSALNDRKAALPPKNPPVVPPVVATGGGPTVPDLNGGGISNVSFLQGKQDPITSLAPLGEGNVGPVAHADFMKARYWIEVVQYKVTVPKVSKQATLLLRPTMPLNSSAPTPVFAVTTPVGGVPATTEITIPGIQIQSSQTVNLNFGPPIVNLLTWPHVSVATMVPTGPQPFQM